MFCQSLSPGSVFTDLGKAAGASEELLKASANRIALNGTDIADSIIYLLSTPPHVNVSL